MYFLFSSIRRKIVISSFCIVFLFSIYSVEAEGQDEEYVEPIKEIGKTPPLESCNCAAFRLDDIQGFWLNKPQIAIIETFQNKNLPLTIGIIGGEKFKFGEDPKITNFVKKAINADGSLIEVANHGWEHESFPTFDRNTQSDLIKKSTERISNLLEVTPKVFIPPFNEFDQDTLWALEENNYTHLSSMWDMDPPPYPFQGLAVYNFPETATTGTYNPNLGIFQKIDNKETFEDVKKSIDSNGFAVITMHPQEFSIIENGTYTNQVDWNQINELELLIEKIQKSGLNLVFLSQINENVLESFEYEKMELPKNELSNFNKFKEVRHVESSGISCMLGEVEVIRVTNPNSICIDQDTALRWAQLGIAEIIGIIEEKETIEEIVETEMIDDSLTDLSFDETPDRPGQESSKNLEYVYKQDFIPQEKIEIDLETLAVFITDPQNDFLSYGGAAWELVGNGVFKDQVVEHLSALKAVAREVEIPVFYSPHTYTEQEYTNWNVLNPIDKLMLSIDMFHEGSWGNEFHPYLIPDDNTHVLNAHKGLSSFHSEDTVLQLRQNGITTIVLAGMATNLCVESHLRDAIENGFQVIVISDATAGADPYSKDAALTNFDFIANEITTTEDIINRLKQAEKE